MAQSFLIIDGYNLMHAAGMARLRYGPGDLERCRNQLLSFLSTHLSSAERERATIVFDASDAPPGLDRTAVLDGMAILFAPRGSDADSTIEEMIELHSAPKQILVVSSDHRLQKAARKRRAKFVDSEPFIERLESRAAKQNDLQSTQKSSIPSQKLSGRVSRAEVSEWLDIFSEVPEAQGLESGVERLQREVDKIVEDADD